MTEREEQPFGAAGGHRGHPAGTSTIKPPVVTVCADDRGTDYDVGWVTALSRKGGSAGRDNDGLGESTAILALCLCAVMLASSL